MYCIADKKKLQSLSYFFSFVVGAKEWHTSHFLTKYSAEIECFLALTTSLLSKEKKT